MQTVGIVRGNVGYEKMFIGMGWDVVDVIAPDEVSDKLDLVLFTGGTDVSPIMYGQVSHPKTGAADKVRDIREKSIFEKALKEDIPMAGICRGSQFLCVMNGGKLIQHVAGHALSYTHKMITADGEEMDVTSTHHQMMQPDESGKLLAWAEGLSSFYEGPLGQDVPLSINGVEPEVVVWEETRSVGFQYHPEYMYLDSPAVKYFFEIVGELVNETA